MEINIDKFFNFKISTTEREKLTSQLKRIYQGKIENVELYESYVCKGHFTRHGKTHLDTLNSISDKLLNKELNKVVLLLTEIMPLLNKNNKDLTKLVTLSFICEIQDLISSLDLVLNKGNFISGYGLIRNLKERILNVMIINENKDERARIYHNYYQNFLRDFYGKDIEGEGNKWWFKNILEYKDDGIFSLMDKFGIIGYHFNSQYTHGNFGTYSETPYHSYALVIDTYGKNKGDDKYLELFLEDYYPIHLEIVALLIDMLESFKDDNLNDYMEYLMFIHRVIMIKTEEYVGFCKNENINK